MKVTDIFFESQGNSVSALKSQIEPRCHKTCNHRETKKEDKSTWAIGGTTMMGLGVGLIYLKTSVPIFIASILIGIGAGLVITSVLSSRKQQ